MKAVKSSKNKSTELKLISIFKENKLIGWRRNYNLYGKPDFVFPKKKIAIFVDGCFWHGHNCRNTNPKQNAQYWNEKIRRNVLRDLEVNEKLKNLNWKILRFWECDLVKKQDYVIDTIKTHLTQ